MTVVRIAPDALGYQKGDKLGSGGQGDVYPVANVPSGLTGPLAYKQYQPGKLVSPDVLEDMVGFCDRLPPRERRRLVRQLAWPLALTVRGDSVDGFLMPRVPGQYLRPPEQTGAPGKPQGIEFLLNGKDYEQKVGLQVSTVQRLELLSSLARLTQWLHGHGIAVGDLSPKNVLFTLAGVPSVMLIDCDSMRFQGRDALDQVDTDDWEAPDGARATTATDAYKLGLLAIRLIGGSQDSRDSSGLHALSGELGRLADRSQDRNAARRPAPSEWLGPLERAIGAAAQTMRAQSVPPTGQAGTGAAGAPTLASSSFASPSPSLPPRIVTPPGRPGPAAVQAPPAQPRRRRLAGALLGLAAVCIVLIVGLATFWNGDTSSADGGPGALATDVAKTPDLLTAGGSVPTGAASAQDSPSPSAQASFGSLTVDYSAVADNSEAPAVAQMFAEFYGNINAQQYDAALGYYDPDTNAVDLSSQSATDNWKHVMSTTQESQVVLTGLTDSGDYTLATVQFRSQQADGYGPSSDPHQTCTDWTISYDLTQSGGQYRIFKAPSSGVSFTGC